MGKAKWFKRKDGAEFKVSDDKVIARLTLDPDFETIADPSNSGGEAPAKTELEELSEAEQKALAEAAAQEQKIRDDARAANTEAVDIVQAEEQLKDVSKDVSLTTDSRQTVHADEEQAAEIEEDTKDVTTTTRKRSAKK